MWHTICQQRVQFDRWRPVRARARGTCAPCSAVAAALSNRSPRASSVKKYTITPLKNWGIIAWPSASLIRNCRPFYPFLVNNRGYVVYWVRLAQAHLYHQAMLRCMSVCGVCKQECVKYLFMRVRFFCFFFCIVSNFISLSYLFCGGSQRMRKLLNCVRVCAGECRSM